MDRRWLRDNAIAVAALVLSLTGGAYDVVRDTSVESYNVQQLVEQTEELSKMSTTAVTVQGDISLLRTYSINHDKRLDNLEQNQNTLLSDQRVTNEILKNMTQVSQELSINVKELTKVVERVARLEERVRTVEDGGRIATSPTTRGR